MSNADLDLDALEALAAKATPGPWCAFNGAINSWKQDDRGEAIVGCMGEVVIGCGRVDCAKPRITDAAFIAAANPATVLALVARIRDLEAALDTARSNETCDCGRILNPGHCQVCDNDE